MKRYASVLIERGTPLHQAAIKEGKALIGKLACIGASTIMPCEIKPKKDNTERFVLVFNTGREVDDWIYARWRQDESQTYIKLSAWMTEQVYKGWNILHSQAQSPVMHAVEKTQPLEATHPQDGSAHHPSAEWDAFASIDSMGEDAHGMKSQPQEPCAVQSPTASILRELERNHEGKPTQAGLERFRRMFIAGD